MTGYLHSDYAHSLTEFGKPLKLLRCKGWILKRKIPDFPYHDAMGCYPLFSCQNWSELYYDLDNNIQDDVLCLSLVTDPFGEFDEEYLKCCFRDLVVPFKEHFITDLKNPLDTIVSSHHRRYSLKGLKNVTVEICQNPIQFLDEWESLYATLIERHNIKGIPAFSRSAFRKQLQVPGIVAFRAVNDSTTVGMLLWYVQGEIAYYHLGAYSEEGYELYASYALFWHAIEHFSEMDLRWLNLGAGSGASSKSNDGLGGFKQGWSTESRTAYFCGRIFDHSKYSEIVEAKRVFDTDYFPAYRKGEFG